MPLNTTINRLRPVITGLDTQQVTSIVTQIVTQHMAGEVTVPLPQRVFVQSLRPTETGPWLWVKTDSATKEILDIIANDGVA